MSNLREGDRISNYLLEARLGAGSFGEVWRAKHHVFNDVVAVKIPTDAQYVRNLQREGVAVHGLHHPNIVRAIDLDPYGDPPYLIMELVQGPTLRAAIDAYGGEFPVRAAVAVMRGMLQALGAAHDQGLVHRDVKPANVILAHPLAALASITAQAVKVTDFGLGRIGGLTAHSMMQSGSVLTEEGRSLTGTIAYMSPEQRESGEVDARSDLYSCGIVFYEMLTGERPQGHEAPTSLRPQLPPTVDEFFRRCYTRHDRRFRSANEALATLGTCEGPVPRYVPEFISPAGGHVCPACRSPVDREDQFCIRCGRQLVAAVPQCPACRAYVHSNDRYCIKCGKDLTVLA